MFRYPDPRIFENGRRPFEAEHANATTERSALTTKPFEETARQRRRRLALETTIKQIEVGANPWDGMSAELTAVHQLPEVQAMGLARPGFATIDRALAQARQERADADAAVAEAEAEVWPRPFRFLGREGQANLEGRWLSPGDVVNLTKAQARAFRDRFLPAGEPVSI